MEKDLFGPIKDYFTKMGYTCDGEVDGIDLYMEKGDETAAVELKVSLDFKVVIQAALRQKLVDTVYIGTFSNRNIRAAAFRDKVYLLKRLGIGLILVSKRSKAVNIVSDPVVSELASFKARNKSRSRHLAGEFEHRRTKLNVGGVNKTKLITSYREDALLVLNALAELGGEATPKQVKEFCGIEKSCKILHANYYGWFENVRRGTYCILPAGYDALEEFEEVLLALMHPGK